MYHYAPKQIQRHQQQLGEFNWLDAVTSPDETIEKYKAVAVKEGTMLLLMFAGALVIGNYLMLNVVISNKLKKSRS